jgi:hypothetical protein
MVILDIPNPPRTDREVGLGSPMINSSVGWTGVWSCGRAGCLPWEAEGADRTNGEAARRTLPQARGFPVRWLEGGLESVDFDVHAMGEVD